MSLNIRWSFDYYFFGYYRENKDKDLAIHELTHKGQERII